MNKIKFTMIISIITFLIGIFFTYASIGLPLKYILIILLISFFPFILFLTITIFYYRFIGSKKNISPLKMITIIFSSLLIPYYLIALFLIGGIEASNPITNIKYYNHYVNDYLTKAFPSKIPDNVEKIKFCYAPGFLQGATNYSLYYIDKEMTLDKFNDLYEEKALWIGYEKDYRENRGLLDDVFYDTPAYSKNENDYVIYIVEGKCDDSGYCNHGNYLLTAYNEKTNEIIFLASNW